MSLMHEILKNLENPIHHKPHLKKAQAFPGDNSFFKRKTSFFLLIILLAFFFPMPRHGKSYDHYGAIFSSKPTALPKTHLPKEKIKTSIQSASYAKLGESSKKHFVTLSQFKKSLLQEEAYQPQLRPLSKPVMKPEQTTISPNLSQDRLNVHVNQSKLSEPVLSDSLSGISKPGISFHDGIKLNGTDAVDPWTPLVKEVLEKKKFQEALHLLQAHQPKKLHKHPQYYALLSYVYLKTGQCLKAIELYQALTGLFPHDAKLWLGLGVAAKICHQNNLALNAYMHAKQEIPSNTSYQGFLMWQIHQLNL